MIDRSAGNETANRNEKTLKSIGLASLRSKKPLHTSYEFSALPHMLVPSDGASSLNMLCSGRHDSVFLLYLNYLVSGRYSWGARIQLCSNKGVYHFLVAQELVEQRKRLLCNYFADLGQNLNNGLRVVKYLLFKLISCTIHLYYLSQPPLITEILCIKKSFAIHPKPEKHLSPYSVGFFRSSSVVLVP